MSSPVRTKLPRAAKNRPVLPTGDSPRRIATQSKPSQGKSSNSKGRSKEKKRQSATSALRLSMNSVLTPNEGSGSPTLASAASQSSAVHQQDASNGRDEALYSMIASLQEQMRSITVMQEQLRSVSLLQEQMRSMAATMEGLKGTTQINAPNQRAEMPSQTGSVEDFLRQAMPQPPMVPPPTLQRYDESSAIENERNRLAMILYKHLAEKQQWEKLEQQIYRQR